MRELKFCLILFIASGSVFAQGKVSIEEKLEKLEAFMEERIPTLNSAIIAYGLTIENGLLRRAGLTEEGESYNHKFNLKGADIIYEYYKLDADEAQVYGFNGFWEVYVNGSYFHTEIIKERDAELIVRMLKALQKSIE